MRIIVIGLAAVLVLTACGGGPSDTAAPASTDAATEAPAEATEQEASAPGEPDTGDGEAPAMEEGAPSPESSPAPTTPIDRLLPDEVYESYAASYLVDNTSPSSEDRSNFPTLEKVRPKQCTPLLELMTSPLADDNGALAGYASNYVSTRTAADDLGPSYTQRIITFDTPEEAQARFAAASALLEECRTATGEWPQTGTIIIDDGMINERLEFGKIQPISDTVIAIDDQPSYDGFVTSFSTLALVDNSIMWLEFDSWGELTAQRARGIAERFRTDAVEYAMTGEVPPPPSDEVSNLTLDCLELTPLPYSLIKNYSQFYGPGQGDDLFVEVRQSAANNCGKEIRGYKYDITFADEFGDEFFSGNGTVKGVIPPGGTKKSPTDTGFTLSRVINADEIKTFTKTDPADITVSMNVTQILFKDKTSLP